jgi:hypothetical protein
MSNIPLVNNNSIDAINTSIIAIKKNLNNNDQIQDVDVNVGINIATNCTYCAASSTTIKGAQLYNGCSIKVLFTSAITGSDTTTPMSINYNGVRIPVKTGKNGVLSNFVANNIDGSYIYCQAYTTLELLFDGTQFIIMGNPVVISSADYTIYTDGSITYNGLITSDSGIMQAVATRVGNAVTLIGQFINSGSVPSSTKFGNIAKICRPTSNITTTAYANGSTSVTFHVYKDGTFDYVSGATRSTLEFAVTYTV